MSDGARTRDEIQAWLRSTIAAELHIDPGTIDLGRPVTFYGLDSLTAATLSGDLEDWLGRPIPDDLMIGHASIETLADRLVGSGCPASDDLPQPARLRRSDRIDYSSLDYERIPLAERLTRFAAAALVRATTILDVEGVERVPRQGPLLLACNHLHILDVAWMAAVLTRRAIFLVAEEFERKPVVGALLNTAQPIYIARGRGDRRAIEQALAVLAARGALVVAPEGRLSRTGGLVEGQSGIAYIASRSGVPVLPMVLYGQEQAGRWWRRLSRVAVRARVGAPLAPPPPDATAKALEDYTGDVMRGLARILPPAYQGVYRQPAAR